MLASEEEGQIVQKKFYDHMVADKNNKFAVSMKSLLESNFEEFHQKEMLLLEVSERDKKSKM